MNTLNLILVSIIVLVSCNQTTTSNSNTQEKNTIEVKEIASVSATITKDTTFNFNSYELDLIPSGWSQYFTGKGNGTEWKILDDGGNKVLAQLSEEDIRGHFNEIVFDGINLKNVELIVRLKGVKGKRDQGGGFVWRFIDADNHYIVRANPLEDNVVLYKMEKGVRTDLPLIGKGKTYGVDVEPLGDDWNTLKLTVKDDLFTVYLNDKEIFQVSDKTFPDAGKIGLWTKADAVTYFDDFQIKSISEK